MAHIHGFSPYFYCTASDDFTDEHCAEFMKTLNDNALKQLTAQHSAVKVVVLAVELQMKESIFGFHGNRKRKFLQVTVTQHAMINKCKRVLESGFNVGRLGHQVGVPPPRIPSPCIPSFLQSFGSRAASSPLVARNGWRPLCRLIVQASLAQPSQFLWRLPWCGVLWTPTAIPFCGTAVGCS